MNRLRRLLTTSLVSLFIAGCVAVPPRPSLLGSHDFKYQDLDACAEKPDRGQGLQGLDPTGFSISSWNIYKQQLSGWTDDARELSLQSDILLLQEASLRPEFQGWLEEQMLEWDMSPAFSYRGVTSGVMTLGRLPAGKNCAHLQTEPWLRIPKAVLASYYPVEGSDNRLLVVNMHAVNFTLGTADLKQQLYLVSDYLQAHGGPVILAGDFNTWSDARQRVLDDFTRHHGLDHVTFEGQQPAQHFGSTVDHIFFRGLIPLQGDVHVVESSDHYPLQVRFALTGNPVEGGLQASM